MKAVGAGGGGGGHNKRDWHGEKDSAPAGVRVTEVPRDVSAAARSIVVGHASGRNSVTTARRLHDSSGMRRRLLAFGLTILCGLIACGGRDPRDGDSSARTGRSGDAGLQTGTASASAAAAVATDPPPAGDSTARRGARAAPDSAIVLTVGTRIKGRSRRDSISLVATIRRGLRDPRWPVRTPPPAPGSIVPARRIVAFYGNPLSKKMGILGEIPADRR